MIGFIRQCIALWRFTRKNRRDRGRAFGLDEQNHSYGGGIDSGPGHVSYRPILMGPFEDRDAAAKARDELNEIMGGQK